MNTTLAVRKAAAGDGRAMRLLYAEYKNEVYFICRLFLTENQAPKAVESVFENTWQDLMKFGNTVRSFENLLRANLVRCCKNGVQIALNDNYYAEIGQKELINAVCSLDMRQKLPIVMVYMYGMTAKEIAVMLKMGEQSVATAIKSGRENLKVKLSEIYPGSNKKDIDILLAKVGAAMHDAEKQIQIPDNITNDVLEDINKRAVKRKLNRKQVILAVLCIAVAVTIFTGIGVIIENLNGENIHHAEIEIYGYGTIAVELDSKAAPITVDNFISLAKNGFYDGLTIHRVVKGFMMQGGDPDGNGTGGSGNPIKGEFSENGIKNSISHERGVISMARSDDYNSASSQFFIMQEDALYLDGKYAAFGHVTSGIEIVDEICNNTPIQNTKSGYVAAENQPIIKEIRIID